MSRNRSCLAEFVQGAAAWEEVPLSGVEVDFDRWTIREAASSDREIVRVKMADVAKGFRVYAGDPEGLRRWAFVILGASNHIDLTDEFDLSPEGDLVLRALWDAAYGQPVREEAQKVLANLRGPDGPPGDD